ncbi:glycosyltransferase [Mycolicibacterium gadium]|jgi:UDP:flavonoid glycosyltransferase YjiC (YdhE family)|uniref:glycosyltransferase n=1 Tax=Mycolicibacterium gadium TaxID=1794 RepID=UPI002FDEDCA0
MKFVLASYGTRGDVEPYVAVGQELMRRGHVVRMAVSPDQVGFAEAAGLPVVAYGPDSRQWQTVHRELLARLPRNFWQFRDLTRLVREDWNLITHFWDEAVSTLTSLADGADLVFTSVLAEEPAANVAEYYDIPLATLHYFPMRPNGQIVRGMPRRVGRAAMELSEWLAWPLTKKLGDAQRDALGLPKSRSPSARRIAEHGSLEIQGYDEACFPGLAAEWARFGGRRPFVGALTMELPTDADEEVASWIGAGTPPIFFGFGSMPVQSSVDTLAMISAACAELGERALVCSGSSNFTDVSNSERVKVVGTMNYAAAFPSCRAVVHHGGVGTTAAGLRAGVPTLVLPTWADQSIWAAQVQRLKVGRARPISKTTRKSLVADLRSILTAECVARAREIASRMTKSAESVAMATDLVHDFARSRRIC